MTLIWTNVWEALADSIGEQPAIVQGNRTVSWADYDDRAARLAGAFSAAGLGPDSKVGMFMYNCPEYLETQFAAFKIRAVPINVNYRYLDDELAYLLDNADAEAVVYHTSLGDRIDRVRARLPRLRLLVEVDDGGDVRVDGAVPYPDVIASSPPAPRIAREPADVYMLYTGGTTGMPKGVMYSMGAFTSAFAGYLTDRTGGPPFTETSEIVGLAQALAAADMLPRSLPACPLMHGTGVWLGAMLPQLTGGACVLMEGRSLDADELWSTVDRHGVTAAVIVGDAFARPMLRALEARRDAGSPYDLSSLETIVSSGAMFSTEVKQGLLDHCPKAVILDVLGSTEGGMAQNVTSRSLATETARFSLQPGTKVFDDDGREVEPGSGRIGMVATTGANVPLGYFKDPEKSARTFREIDGVRYSFPGDMAIVEADGSITLLGRGSNCINSGGEKIFPEEVEEAVKTHPDVDDCLVFGVDDERFGQRVVGVASLAPGGTVSADDLIAHTKGVLAHFKAPRQLVFVDQVPRAPNGKADYARARELAEATLGAG